MPPYQIPDFRRLPAGLGAIFARDGRHSFFDLPQWYDLMARFGVPDGADIRVFIDERPGSLVAVPLQAVTENGRRCLISLANFYSVEHGLITAPDADLKRGLAAILSEIRADRPRWDCLRLAELDPRDPSYAELCRALRGAGFLVECTFASGTWYEETSGLSFASYLDARAPELRNTWRRKRRSLERSGRLKKAFFPGDISVAEAIADYEAAYATSWKTPEPFPHFMPALIGLAAKLGALRLGIYYVDGVSAAAQFWLLWNGRAVIYKLAHDKRLDALSLGTLLTMEMIERALESDRPREINFGRGDDPYKKLWLPKRRERWGITASNPRTVAGLALGLEREAAKLYHRLRGERTTPPNHDATA
jgi:hypothetical protein